MHFLLHERIIAAFLRSLHVVLHSHPYRIGRSSLEIIQLDLSRLQNRNLPVFHGHDFTGIFQQCRDVTRTERRIRAFSQNHRGVLSGGIDRVGKIRADHTQGKTAFQIPHRVPDGFQHIPLVVVIQHVHNDFAVCLGMKPVARVLQKTPDGLMVFNDAIVDNGNGLCLIRMGMGIQIAGDAVCRPSRMTDPGCLRPAAAFHRRLQRRQASPGFYCRQALGSDKGHTRGIISAVFEFFQSLHQKGQSRSGACKCSDSTHKKNLHSSWRVRTAGLFSSRGLVLSAASGCTWPPGHPPNLSINLVLVNCRSSPGACSHLTP